ncbi:MAG: DUF4160 domain-containing protein [Bacteroidetes bacterium]|nr:DUF4160 domain-containing protein [Bacteroidota bacterium]MBL7105276.1 DUF4160 domain-containing protein [Bacteroidales bacterium]
MSPTIFRIGPYRFFFFSREEEKKHVHVVSGDGEAKYWLEPEIELAKSHGLNEKQLNKLLKLVEEKKNEISAKWDEYFNN